MTGHPLRPATRQSLGRPSPHQQADRPRAHPPPKTPKGASFPDPPCDRPRISRISHTFMRLSRRRGQVTHVLLTRSPLIQNQQADPFTVRLACVKHAASVRPEPGSNSPNKKQSPEENHPPTPQHNKGNKRATPTKKLKNKNRHKNKTNCRQTNTLSSSQTTPTQTRAHGEPVTTSKEKGFAQEPASPEPRTAAPQRNEENNTQPTPHRQTHFR